MNTPRHTVPPLKASSKSSSILPSISILPRHVVGSVENTPRHTFTAQPTHTATACRGGGSMLPHQRQAMACNMRQDYWLYAVYNCATSNPRLARVQDPFGNLLAKAKGSVLVSHAQITEADIAGGQKG